MRAWIYDRAVRPLTTRWYRAVLDRLDPGTRLLDVGVGTAGALVGNADLLRSKDLHVTGVDIDADYIRTATRRVAAHDLADHAAVRHESVYDHRDGPYDAAYFSASFMLLPRPAEALHHVLSLQPGPGRVLFTQTFQERRSAFAERTKPLLKRVTTIDFGAVTYEADFRATLEGAGLELTAWESLGGRGSLHYRLVEARPRS